MGSLILWKAHLDTGLSATHDKYLMKKFFRNLPRKMKWAPHGQRERLYSNSMWTLEVRRNPVVETDSGYSVRSELHFFPTKCGVFLLFIILERMIQNEQSVSSVQCWAAVAAGMTDSRVTIGRKRSHQTSCLPISTDSCKLNGTISPLCNETSRPFFAERVVPGTCSFSQILHQSKEDMEKRAAKCRCRYDVFQRICTTHKAESVFEQGLPRKIWGGRNSSVLSTPYAERWHFGNSTYISDLAEIYQSMCWPELSVSAKSNSVPENALEHVCALSIILTGLVMWYRRNYDLLSVFSTKCLLHTFSIASASIMVKSFQRKRSVAAAYWTKQLTVRMQAWLWSVGLYAFMCLLSQSMACVDNSGISDWNCLEYDSSRSMVKVTCSFDLSNCDDCITLHKNEVFEGHGHQINVSSCLQWEGLFEIDDSVTGLDNAPVIRNLHITGGETTVGGGFVIRSGQKNFIVDSCSSTGEIDGGRSGGICGEQCPGDFRMRNCSSSGDITGDSAGGIVGSKVGVNDNGTVVIENCHSTGDIVGRFSGGICGWAAGRDNGHVTITHSYSTGQIGNVGSGGICGSGAGYDNGNVTITYCYSTGEITGRGSGGICGHFTGFWNATVRIEQCYSLGEISGPESGGIVGRWTARPNGYVSITNCYSRGHITGSDHAGGVCGADTPHPTATGGIVILMNVYASGNITHKEAGGLIGEIDDEVKQVNIIMSVYNGDTGSMIGGSKDADSKQRNSGRLSDIIGTVYCYKDQDNKECWNTETVWQPVENDFPSLLAVSAASRTSSPLPSPNQRPRRIFTQLSVQHPRRTVVNRS